MHAHTVFLALLLLVGLAGCGSVDNTHPLSDDTTTVEDDALVGYWLLQPKAEPKPDQLPLVFVVGRSSTHEKWLEFAWLQLDRKQRVKVHRLGVIPTVIAGRRYVSLANPEERDEFTFIAYEYGGESKDELWISLPDVAYFVRAVEKDELEGTVKGDSEDLSERVVHLDVGTKPLRAWIEKHAGAAWKRGERPLRRLKETLELGD